MVTRQVPVGATAVEVPAQPSVLVGWGALALTGFTAYARLAWGPPVPAWLPLPCLFVAALWPGRYSPRACMRALVRAASRAAVGVAAALPAGPLAERVRVPVWAWCAGAGVAALGATRVWAHAPLPVLGGLAAVVLAAVLRPLLVDLPGARIRRADSLSDLSSGGGADGLALWRSEVIDRWYAGVRTVPALVLREGEDEPEDEHPGYVRVDPPAGTHAAKARPIIATAEIVDDDVRPVPGGVAFAVDTAGAMKIADDVAASVDKLRRVLGATEVLVEPVPAVADLTLVTAYRGQPWHGRPPVDWRKLRAVPGGRELVPVGETAHADLLGADGKQLEVGGRQAVLSHRESLLIVSAANAGKTGLVRAYKRGLLVQGVPFRPVLLDNKGDYAALADAVAELGGIYTDNPADFPAAVDWAWSVGEGRYLHSPGYQHTPTLTAPLILVVIAEWLDFVDWARAAKHLPTLERASAIPRRHRGSAVNIITTAQAAQQKQLTAAREFFPQRAVLRVDNDDQVDMALGDGMFRRGAHAHLIPPDAQGCFWAKDRRTGFPYLGRAAWIPETDQGAALVDPMTELGRRMRAAREENA